MIRLPAFGLAVLDLLRSAFKSIQSVLRHQALGETNYTATGLQKWTHTSHRANRNTIDKASASRN